MNDDLYLSIIADSYKNGYITEEKVRENLWAYQKENGLDEKAVNEFLQRLIPVKSYTVTEKRNILENINFNGGNIKKYPKEVLDNLPDITIEHLFEKEKQNLGEKEIKRIYDEMRNNINESPKIEKEEVKEENKEPKVVIENKKDDTNQVGSNWYDVEKEKNESSWYNSNLNNKDMPEDEEEFESIHENQTRPEEDSNVKSVNAPKERIEKLKKDKKKIKRYFIKGLSIVVASYFLIGAPFATLGGLAIGYAVLSKKIKEGTFNPVGDFGISMKEMVEKIMNIGKNKDEERGKSR